MNDVAVIDRFLDVFSRYIDSGFGLLGGEVRPPARVVADTVPRCAAGARVYLGALQPPQTRLKHLATQQFLQFLTQNMRSALQQTAVWNC